MCEPVKLWEVLDMDRYLAKPKKLNYKIFNRGSRKGPSSKERPCDQWFLNAIISDLILWSFRLGLLLPHIGSTKARLGPEAIMAAQNVFRVMRECRRLRSAFGLFPSDHSRKEFFRLLSPICKGMHEFNQAHSGMDMDPGAFAASFSRYNTSTWTELHRNQSSSFFPERFMGKVPFWHPLNIGQNIWNKWLDNRCCYEMIPPIKNKIVQRLPDVAARIEHRAMFMYNIVERSYAQAGRVTRLWPKNRRELLAATGENHEIRKFVHGNLWQMMDLGLPPLGGYMRIEVHGVISLERISLAITQMYNRQQVLLDTSTPVCVLVRG